jgi:dTDP-4-dehydrorhamnose 3,5-epimerase
VEVIATGIPDVKILRPRVFGDPRGFFVETWNRRTLSAAGLDVEFVQDNHSRSGKGTLRGLHYQTKQTQGKLVRAATGRVFDVAVDLRRSSPTFGRWVGAVLSDENQEMLWVPPGFAHGFLVLSTTADFQYKCTDFYAPEHEQAIRWNDPDLAIDWPLPDGQAPLLSAKDLGAKPFASAATFP